MLTLCADAGLVDAGVLAVDGTKLEASAPNHAIRGYERIAAEILAEPAASTPPRTRSRVRPAATSYPSS